MINLSDYSSSKEPIVVICGGASHPYLDLIKQLEEKSIEYVLIGVDRGALRLVQAGYHLDYAYGDFDSVTKEEFQLIEIHSTHLTRVSSHKDDTDMELTLESAMTMYPNSDYFLMGALGKKIGRLDHLLANIWLVYQPRFVGKIDKVIFVEASQYLTILKAGEHVIDAVNTCDYISFISLTAIKNWSIKGAKYELDSASLDYPRAFISNEFVGNCPIEVKFDEGLMMCLIVKE